MVWDIWGLYIIGAGSVNFGTAPAEALSMKRLDIGKWAYVVLRLVITRRNSVSHGTERIRITSKYGLGFDPIFANEISKKNSRIGTSLSSICNSWVCIQSRKYSDWWNTSRSAAFTKCLDFTAAFRHYPHRLPVYTGQREAVSDCITWIALKLTMTS